MRGKTVVVTGANTGIGLETARALAAQGATVVMTARSRERGEPAVADVRATTGAKVELLMLDLASLASVRAAAKELLERHPRLDVLVNNAGLMLTERQVTKDGFEATFGTNHLGPFLLTNLLLDRLRASAPARIVNVASDAHYRAKRGIAWDDLQAEKSYSGFDVYGKSKLANVLFTVELARLLDGSGVTANSLHPGVVATSFASDGDAKGLIGFLWRLGKPFLIGPAEGARTSIFLASAPEVAGVSGRYFAKCKEKTPSRFARDADAARRLWDLSAKLTGVA